MICKAVILLCAMLITTIHGYAQEKTYNPDSLYNVVERSMTNESVYDDSTTFKHYFNAIDSLIKPEEWAEMMKADVMKSLLSGYSSSDLNKIVDLYMYSSKNDSLKNVIRETYGDFRKKYGHLFTGQPAPDITFTDKQGKKLSLRSFRGKTLLVDIWGTWCGPCIAEMPYLEKLQAKYGNRKDVMIMSIACDKNVGTWKAFLGNHHTTWHQFIADKAGNKTLDDKYFCIGIPRFIVIDKNGNLINADATRPSDKDFDNWFMSVTDK